MITRPLDLASKLRPEPRNFDWLFFVNAGLIVLFFALFGSRFVLAPGLALDFRLPVAAGAHASARSPTHVIDVMNAGQIFTVDGLTKLNELQERLTRQRRDVAEPLLLVRASADVPGGMLADITSVAKAAGFDVLWATEEAGLGARPEAR